MNRLIKRYILKAQRDKDNDEVNEGERRRSHNAFHIRIAKPSSDTVPRTVPQVN